MNVNPYAAQWEQFKASTPDHELHILHNDGLYRHLRMKAPTTSIWHWDVITWPGHLCIDGDIGDGHVFSREPDMIDFFAMGIQSKHSDGSPWIDVRYWAEKLSRGANTVKTYSGEAFLTHVRESLADRDLGPADIRRLLDDAEEVADYEHDAREWLNDRPSLMGTDTWEWDLTDWDHHFLLSCYAIAHTVERIQNAERSES